MKHDIDLMRQILLDIENHGSDCSLKALRSEMAQATSHDLNEQIRYHLRLLIDAGLAKEIDRTSAGTPCVRLTHAGQEFIELARSDARWGEAKWVVQEQTGGLSLTVLRALLTKWAIEAASRGGRGRRLRSAYRPPYTRDYRELRDYYPMEPSYRVDSYRYERDPLLEEEDLRLIRSQPDYRERVDYRERYNFRDRWDQAPYSADEFSESSLGVSLPVYMI